MRALLPESRRGAIACLALAVIVSYFNALSGAFQFDDYKAIVNNPSVHSWEAWLAGLGHGIRPLLKFSYTLDWTLGLGKTGFHLTNLLIHLVNTWLVFRLSETFIGRQMLRERLQYVPLFAALLFAAHPAHTEAVTYICGRSTSLMTLFYLGGLLAYVTGRIRQNRIMLYAVTPLMFVLALSVKETAVTFPLALLAWELGCGGAWKTAFRPQWPSWAVLLAGALFFLFNDSYLSQAERSAQLNSLQGNLATQLFAFSYLLRQWALPLWLNIDPDLPLLHDLSGSSLPLLFFGTLFALMLACRRKRPWINFALAWAIIHLLALYLFLPRVDIANDRQLYLADWPLFLALAIELALLLRTSAFRLTAAALALSLAALTVARNQVYVSETTLWEDTVRKSPHKARVHNNLGYAYRLAGRIEDARREFILALQLDPKHIKARHNLEYLDEALPENHPAPEKTQSPH
ncbi:MAG: tetratricopeptide repeat protein [Gallionellaceae bacterium]|nr:tetratricopeptide repeat protein [Gallionellaceae bacterium]MDP1997628.1 tetratricopeptide repeat protein [Gallionella sp.]